MENNSIKSRDFIIDATGLQIKINNKYASESFDSLVFLKWFLEDNLILRIKNFLYVGSIFAIFCSFCYQAWYLSRYGMLWAFSPQQLLVDSWVIWVPILAGIIPIFFFWEMTVFVWKDFPDKSTLAKDYLYQKITGIDLSGQNISKQNTSRVIDWITRPQSIPGYWNFTRFQLKLYPAWVILRIIFTRGIGGLFLLITTTLLVFYMFEIVFFHFDDSAYCFKAGPSANLTCSDKSLKYKNDRWSIFSVKTVTEEGKKFEYISIPASNTEKILLK